MNGFLQFTLVAIYFLRLKAERCSDDLPYLTGLRVDGEDFSGYSAGVVEIPPGIPISIRLFGCNLNHMRQLKFTNDHLLCNSSKIYDEFNIYNDESASFQVEFDANMVEEHFDCRNSKQRRQNLRKQKNFPIK
jgi:hypothetical protein